MSTTIYSEQDRGTFSGTVHHRYNGYNAGFNAPRSETPADPRTDQVARRRGRDATRTGS